MNKEELINILTENLGMVDYIEVTKYLCEIEQENKQLKFNWNKLKEYFKYEIEFDKKWYIPESEVYTAQKHFPDDTIDGFIYALNKMQEIEKGEQDVQ